MRLAAGVTVLALAMGAQEVVTLPTGTPRPGAWTGPIGSSTTRTTNDAPLHSNILTLIDLTGDRERLAKTLPKVLDEAKAKLMQAYPGLDPAFGAEWEKRMAARVKIDDFVERGARVYEKHFTSDEVQELIAALQAKKAGKPAQVSAQLQQKFNAEAPAMMGEIVGGNTEAAVKLSTEVASEIGKEHPEYVRRKGPGQLP